MAETPGFRLQTLGSLRLLAPDGRDEPTLLGRRRKLALLALLAITQRPMRRDRLVALFWGEQDEERARHSLSDALSSLRRALGPGAIAARQSEVALDERVPLRVDLRELAEAAKAGEWSRVLALHQAPFLDGVAVAGSVSWEQWVLTQRTGAARIFETACRHEAERLGAAEAWEPLASIAGRWLEQRPDAAAAASWQLTAIARAAPADANTAQRVHDAFDALSRRLDTEYGAHPADSVRATRDALLRELDRTAPVAVASTAPPADWSADASVPPSQAESDTARFPRDHEGDEASPTRRPWLKAAAVVALLASAAAWLHVRRPGTTDASPVFTFTTASPEARRALERASLGSAGDVPRSEALALVEQAIALDSNFAMAHRTRALLLEGDGTRHAEVVASLGRAFAARDRVSAPERALIVSSYHLLVSGDYARASAAQRELLRLDPADADAWHELGMTYQYLGDEPRAADAYRAALARDPSSASTWANLVDAVHASGDDASTLAVLDSMARAIPGHLSIFSATTRVRAARGEWTSAERQARAYLAAAPDVPRTQGIGELLLSRVLWSAGRLDEGDASARRGINWWLVRGDTVMALRESLAMAQCALWVRRDPVRARRLLDEATRRFPLDSIPLADRPLLELATLEALTGSPARASERLDRFVRLVPPTERRRSAGSEALSRGTIAWRSGRFEEAERLLGEASTPDCPGCGLPEMGLLLQARGDTAGARAALERYLQVRSLRRTDLRDALHRRWVQAWLAGGDRASPLVPLR